MNYIKGSNRDQIVFSSLEIQIEPENPVRFVDAFVEHIGLQSQNPKSKWRNEFNNARL